MINIFSSILNKHFALALFFFLFLTFVFAQNLSLSQKFSQHTASPIIQAKQQTTLLVKGDPKKIKEEVNRLGGTYKYSHGDISAITLPGNKVNALEINNFVKETAKDFNRAVPLLDTSLSVNNVLPVHQGIQPLDQPYTGKGVVMGYLDSGIDIMHPDFWNEDSSSRILYIWDQDAGGDTLQPYGYGIEWTKEDIDNGSCTHNDYFGHGTNVSAIGSSNGMAIGKYTGVAPESDIIIVATNFSGLTNSKVLDAVDYIFKKADSLSKPCVINLSLGNYFGARDGRDLIAQGMNSMMEEKPGRVIVAAAGNAGTQQMHLGYEVTTTNHFTWFKYNPSLPGAWFYLWSDTADFNDVNFKLGGDNKFYSTQGETPFRTIKEVIHAGGMMVDTLYNISLDRIGIAYTEVEYINDSSTYQINIAVATDSTDFLWRFTTYGSGKFDVWTHSGLIGTSNMVTSSELPDASIVPEINNYKAPDKKSTITSSWTCAENVITVGNFSNRYSYLDIDSVLRIAPDLPVGDINSSSSMGPTRDGRIKPEITASGGTSIMAGSASFINGLISSNQRSKVALGGKHMRNGGTSIACPVVAGAAALYLEKYPNATFQEVRNAVIYNAVQDSFTGDTISDTWGYGKIDAFSMLSVEVIVGCTDSTSLNYNSTANLDDSSCIAKIFGCTDSTAFNYNDSANTDDSSCVPIIAGCTDSTATNFNELANTDDGSCNYVGLNEIASFGLIIYPNPVTNEVILTFSDDIKGKIIIYDQLGIEVEKYIISKPTNKLNISVLNYPSGMYSLVIIDFNNIPILKNKFIKL